MADRGRPTIYTEELGQEICQRIMEGETTSRICNNPDMPHRATLARWAFDTEHDFCDKYARAKRIQCEFMAEDIFDISDNGTNDWIQRHGTDEGQEMYSLNGEHVQRSRLRVDSRKWYLSKVVPKFKDKTEIEHTGDPVINLTLNKE